MQDIMGNNLLASKVQWMVNFRAPFEMYVKLFRFFLKNHHIDTVIIMVQM
jgi:hypothetical protein